MQRMSIRHHKTLIGKPSSHFFGAFQNGPKRTLRNKSLRLRRRMNDNDGCFLCGYSLTNKTNSENP